jgi:hypothetical protein
MAGTNPAEVRMTDRRYSSRHAVQEESIMEQARSALAGGPRAKSNSLPMSNVLRDNVRALILESQSKRGE